MIEYALAALLGFARGGVGSPEALALYRINALDAAGMGALEHGP